MKSSIRKEIRSWIRDVAPISAFFLILVSCLLIWHPSKSVPPNTNSINPKLMLASSPPPLPDAPPPPQYDRTNRPIRLTLAWDPSPDTNVVAYKLYWGPETGTYTNTLKVTNCTATVTSMPPVFFAVTAVDDLDLESDFSNEVRFPFYGITKVLVKILESGELSPQGWSNIWTKVLTNPPENRFWKVEVEKINL